MRSDKTDEKVAELLDGARPAYDDTSRERALSAMVRSHAEGASRTATRRGRWIVRAAAAAVVVALGLGLLVIPGRQGEPDVDAIFADVAYAMASADSVLWVCELTDEGLALSERCIPVNGRAWSLIDNAMDLSYYGPRAAYTRRIGGDGVVSYADGVDLDTLEWWSYSRQPRHPAIHWDVLYVADLAPVEAEMADYLSRPDEDRLHDWPYAYHLHAWPWAVAGGLDDEEVSVTSGIRYGREVTVVTFTGWKLIAVHEPAASSWESQFQIARNVLEVDAGTNRLLDAYFYWQFEGEPEQLVAHWRVEYDAPMPTIMAELPDAGEIVEATVAVDETIQSGYEVTELSMVAGGQCVTKIGMRRDQHREAVPETESAFKAGRTELDQVTRNMTNLDLALMMYLADHEDTLPPVDNVDDLMTVLDEYLRGPLRHPVFMRPGTEDEVVVEYLVPLGVKWMEIGDFSGAPLAVADYHPDFAVFAYADGHVEAADKSDPAYQDGWWEDWWREYEPNR